MKCAGQKKSLKMVGNAHIAENGIVWIAYETMKHGINILKTAQI